MIRHCADCGAPYSLEPEEEDWFRREGLTVPKRCARCRADRRGTKERYLTCRFCGRTFAYPRDLQLYARTYGWGTPRRCIGGCADGGGDPENAEERAMRELLERLRDHRQKRDAPPVEAVLDARPPPRARGGGGPSPESLFRGLESGGEGEDASPSLAEDVEQFRQNRTTPDDLFGGLESRGEAPGKGGSRKRGQKKKRRPRPRH